MKKSSIWMFAAALALSSALTATSAPLAKRVTAEGVETQTSDLLKVKAPMDEGVRMPQARTLRNSTPSGLHKIQTPVASRRQQAAASATAAQRAVTKTTNLRGSVLYADAWNESGSKYGLYKIPHGDGSDFQLIEKSVEYPIHAGYDGGDGYFYSCKLQVSMYGIPEPAVVNYKMENMSQSNYYGRNTLDWTSIDLAKDPSTGLVYGCTYNAGGGQTCWKKIDYKGPPYQGPKVESIKEGITPLWGVACDKNGQYYGLTQDGVLYTVEKTTGEMEEIARTDFYTEYKISACFNDANGTILATYSTDAESGLVEIDPETGDMETICIFPDNQEVTALWIADPEAADKAPGYPNLTVEAGAHGAMSVNANITLPNTLFDGTPLAEDVELTWTLKAGATVIASGTAKNGTTFDVTADVPKSGDNVFYLTCSNDEGESPYAKASAYIGKGTPAAPTNVKLVWDKENGKATITWDAVTSVVDAGYFDPEDQITYTIKSGYTTVATGVTDLSLTTDLVEPASGFIFKTYTVAAVYDGKTSGTCKSNGVNLGAYEANRTLYINSQDNFDQHTVIDANGDGNTFTPYYPTASMTAAKYVRGENDADDWIISPAFRLEAGKAYPITVYPFVWMARYPETFEVFMGQGTTVADMTTEVIAKQATSEIVAPAIEGIFKVHETGRYNLGVHCLSPKDQGYIFYLSRYTIGTGINLTAPDYVSNVKIEPAHDGRIASTISFKTPTTDLDGNPIQGNLTVKVFKKSTWSSATFFEFTNVKPGTSYSFEHNYDTAGDLQYQITCTNANGEESPAYKQTVYLGPRKPAQVQNVDGWEKNGKVHLNWSPVTKDNEGYDIPADEVTYNVYNVIQTEAGYSLPDNPINAEPLETNSLDIDITSPETQQFKYYAVKSIFSGREAYETTGFVVAGPGYNMPVYYNGGESLLTQIMGFDHCELSLATENTGVEPYEGDDYFLMKRDYQEQTGKIFTGKVKINGERPIFTFATYVLDENDCNENSVSVLCEGVETEIKHYTNDQLIPGEWNIVKMSLEDFAGKEIQIVLRSTVKHYAYSLFDALTFNSDVDFDLSARLTAPKYVETGEEFFLTAMITNAGAQDADSYYVELYRDGVMVDSKDLENLEAGAQQRVVFTQTLGLHDPETADFKVVVNYGEDENEANNTSEVVTVTRNISELPAVEGLTGEATENGHELSWEPIDLTKPVLRTRTEDFEGATAWAQEVEGWTFVDADGQPVGGFSGLSVPNLPVGDTCSFIVWDRNEVGNATYDAHSGSKFIGSIFRLDQGTVDDWAISPELPGVEQTISFWAKSYDSTYPDCIEILYTEFDTFDPDEYDLLAEYKSISKTWTEFKVEVPAEAKHFAIRSHGADGFMLMVDDVTFARHELVNATHVGYNVYCDGVKLNDEPIAEPKFTHTEPTGTHTYHVTAVYNEGESEISLPFTIEQAGLALNAADGVKVAVENRDIVVSGNEAAAPVVIATVDGRVIFNGVGNARVTVAPAFYLVTVKNRSIKVMVR